jgi:hypothetical protein
MLILPNLTLRNSAICAAASSPIVGPAMRTAVLLQITKQPKVKRRFVNNSCFACSTGDAVVLGLAICFAYQSKRATTQVLICCIKRKLL